MTQRVGREVALKVAAFNHASVKRCLTWFINLVQEVATHEVSKAMKVTNQKACVAVAKQPLPARENISQLSISRYRSLAARTVLPGRGTHRRESFC